MYHFIINPRSRSGKGIKIWYVVKQKLEADHISYSSYITNYKFHATEIVHDICTKHEGIKNIIVLGGDGTVNEVINGIDDYDSVLLGYIPSGSSNDLARSLKLPKDPLQSLEHILTPSEFKYVDTGIIRMGNTKTERKFAVSTGIGFDAAICKEALNSNLKNILNKIGLGKLTYIIITLKQLLSSSFMDGTITIDKTVTHSYDRILLITSMIHKYEGGGMRIAPAADPFDGKLSVCIVHGKSKKKVMLLLPTLLFGKHIHFKGVETFDCNTLKVDLRDSTVTHVDGEYPGSYNQIEISCTPKQLRIII